MRKGLFFTFLLFFLTTCDRQLVAPVADNPLDPENAETGGDPFSLTLEAIPEGVQLVWQPLTSLEPDRYLIYRKEAADLEYALAGEVSHPGSTYTDTLDGENLTVNQTYWYFVMAERDHQMTDSSYIQKYTISLDSKIQNLSLNCRREYGVLGVRIDWDLSSVHIPDSSLIYRSESEQGVYNLLAKQPGNIYSYFDPIDESEMGSTFYYYLLGEYNGHPTDTETVEKKSVSILFMIPGSYATIQEGINSSIDGDVNNGDIIYVNNGTYTENIDFKGKAITLRSVNGPENTIIEGNGNGVVVTVDSGEDENSILYGFTIRNGMDYKGGGVNIDGSSPIIRNCIIENNTATSNGGGIYLDRSFALIDSCIIRNNGAEKGGGIYTTDERGLPVFQNCEFTENTSTDDGGAAYVDDMDATFIHCRFHNNFAEEEGGGLYLKKVDSVYVAYSSFLTNVADGEGGGIYFDLNSDNSTIINSIFSGNYGNNGGGAIYSKKAAPTITYSTFWNNTVDKEDDKKGAGIYCNDGSEMMIMNSILWDNVGNLDSEIYFESIIADTLFTIDYSNIKEGHTEWWFGEDCLDANPLFEDSNSGDFHLKEGSPCIGTDSNNTQMGAYGGEYGDWR